MSCGKLIEAPLPQVPINPQRGWVNRYFHFSLDTIDRQQYGDSSIPFVETLLQEIIQDAKGFGLPVGFTGSLGPTMGGLGFPEVG
ncbi:MAG: hypothetical protein ACOYMP_10685 [Nodosilinea sp.]